MQQTPVDFLKLYKELNSAQKKAVDTIEGPVMVLAGPGTGKTQVLSARIANILIKTDINPSNILALTFTESAASTMRDRLVSMIGQAGYYVNINTFHSFCVDVMVLHPEYFSIGRESQPITELERFQLLQDIISSIKLSYIRPINSPNLYLKDIVSSISTLKREGIRPIDFKKLLQREHEVREEKTYMKNKELLEVYLQYQSRLHDSNRYDFEDMIGFVAQAFTKNHDLLTEYQEKLHYFLVDEYQDTNNSQNMILNKLTNFWGENANVFVVGDPNQSIYRFQGASIENVASFMKWYPHATVIQLDTGYRSTQTIYDASHKLIVNNTLTKETTPLFNTSEKSIQSVRNETEPITITEYPSQIVEAITVVEKIRTILKEGVPESEIAILYRHNADAILLRETLEKWGIAYELDGGDDILLNETIRQLLILCRFILKIKDGGSDLYDFFDIASYAWLDILPTTVLKVAETAGTHKIPLYELCTQKYAVYKKIAEKSAVSSVAFNKLTSLTDKIQKWVIDDANYIFPEWFEKVINESGFLDWIIQHDEKVELLTNLTTLFREIKSQSRSNHAFKLRNFIDLIDTLTMFKIELKAEDFNIIEGAIKLSTVHRAKGCEWKYVFLVHCVDKKWGNNKTREMFTLPTSIVLNTDLKKKEQNEDERRLFYVAITRAKKHLSISYPLSIISNTVSKTTIPSMFIGELPEHCINVYKENTSSKKAVSFMEELLRPKTITFYQQIEKGFYKKLIAEMTYSVTTINTYLKDKEEFIKNTLLRVPRAKSGPMAFGTAIHKVLEEFYKHFQKTGRKLTIEELGAIFKISLSEEVLTLKEFDSRYEYGKKIITGYYNTYLLNPIVPFGIERFFGGSERPIYLGNIPISGRLDRLDWIDKKERTLLVIDYKTGAPKTIGEIEGQTISSNVSDREQTLPKEIRGKYKRQLLFYKMLFELDPMTNTSIVKGEFDFIEPSKQSGKCIKRDFDLAKSDVSLLKQLVREVVSEIRSLSFLN